jgi:O-antigen/teichoic acid export membrane protein
MPIMFITALFLGLSMFAPGLNLKNKTKTSALLVIIFAGLNILLNSFWIPIYGIKGAALATLLSTVLYQLSLFVISRRYYTFEIQSKKIFTTVIIFIGSFIVFHYWNPSVGINTFILKLLFIGCYITFLHSINLFDLKKAINLIKRK